MQNVFKFIITLIYRPLVVMYLKKERWYTYKSIRLKVLPGVFHPGLFNSTKIIFRILETQNLKDKKILELGAGSGLLSFYCAIKGAIVTASDISPQVIEGLKFNLDLMNKKTFLNLSIIQSNLFAKIPKQDFDYIIINPPYYAKKAANIDEHAWYAGENMEYFDRLFNELNGYISADTKVLMAFAEIPELEVVKKRGNASGWEFEEILHKNLLYERMVLFRLK